MTLSGLDVLETILFGNIRKLIEIDYSTLMVESFWQISRDSQGIKLSYLNQWPSLVFLRGSTARILIYGPTKLDQMIHVFLEIS